MELGVSEGTASWGRFDMLGFVPDNVARPGCGLGAGGTRQMMFVFDAQ